MIKVELLDCTKNAESVIAAAAATCYDSDPDNAKRVRALVRTGHWSAFSFASAVFKISGISRACTHQLVRHAHLRYLQRSQRYVKEGAPSYVVPPSVQSNPKAAALYDDLMADIWNAYNKLSDLGLRKEDARFVLPNACTSEIAVAGNFQAWRDFLFGGASRLSPKAQWEIRAVAKQIHTHLVKEAPHVFNPEAYKGTFEVT